MKFADIFGFTKEKPAPRVEDELPIQAFSLNFLMDQLERIQIGDLPVSRRFEDEVRWGTTDGSIRARLTPNQGIIIERLTSDLQGQPVWITKKLFKIKTESFVGHEDSVAYEIGEHISTIAHEPIDASVREYHDIFAIIKDMAMKLQQPLHDMFTFQEIKKVTENNYNILLTVGGYGRGKLVGRVKPGPSPAGIIDMSYDNGTGVIKGIVTTVDIEHTSWEIDVPYFLGTFSTSQPMSEIVQIMLAGLKFI